MKKAIIALIAALTICVFIFGVVYAAQYKYPDLTWITIDRNGKEVVNVHYAAREITQASNIGMLDGYPDGTFKPNDSITRAEFIKTLIILATNRTFDFRNVDSKYSTWYGPYVTIAEMQGIMDKNKYTDEEFNEPITRIEAILMLAKTQINMKGIPQNQKGSIAYTDIGDLTPDEKALVLHAAQYDLLEGMKEGSNSLLEPDQNLTRGEAAAALMRIY
ncbi:MAG: S-layer homology domain-containing protein [Clostridia bacterium]|nr:S-layer homology domain-containing protein [Clostridia bacterium]